MKITAEYKGKQVTFDVPDETLDKLIEEPKKTGWEKPERGQWYWYVTTSIGSDRCIAAGDIVDEWRYNAGNYFASKELAENIARYQSLDLRIRRRIAEICEPVDWGNVHKLKWRIYYGIGSRRLEISSNDDFRFVAWYCDTKEHAEQIIEEFKDELLWYFTEFKDRMDG